MKKKILLLLLLLTCAFVHAQAIKDQYIVTIKKGQVDRFTKSIDNDSRTSSATKLLSKNLGIVEVFSQEPADPDFERSLSDNPLVESWAYNYPVEKRMTPNDEYFDIQWGLDIISARDAWEVTTGGTDLFGREIVVVVMDDSYELTHPELEGRIFINEGEIPNDGIDNDNNGYIDDYQGWNTEDENDIHPLTDNHGTAVAGIIGAKTDNELGVAGINWNIKLIIISGIATQAQVIAGYQYAIDMRQRYNNSNGEEGAFVVATNYSAGIDKAFGTDPQFSAWCNMYDALGEVGILSTGATANNNTNVDLEGDIPTTCPSEFLISVTNTDEQDTKVTGAGFGPINIDLGAPGKGTFALGIDGGFDQTFGGTSASTPHVTGAIALLYSVPCRSVADLAFDNPQQAAKDIRDALLGGVDPNSTLDGITVTGGRLNILGAMEKLQELCEELMLPAPKGPLEILKIITANPNQLGISYLTPDESEYTILITDRAGRTILTRDFTPPTIGRKFLNINTPTLLPGIYFISIYNDSNISTQKLFLNK